MAVSTIQTTLRWTHGKAIYCYCEHIAFPHGFPCFPADMIMTSRKHLLLCITSHPVVQRSVKTFLVHIQIVYIHCIYFTYTHTYVTWMLVCASCTLCSGAGALANMMLAWPGSERESSDDFIFFLTIRSKYGRLSIYEYEYELYELLSNRILRYIEEIQ